MRKENQRIRDRKPGGAVFERRKRKKLDRRGRYSGQEEGPRE